MCIQEYFIYIQGVQGDTFIFYTKLKLDYKYKYTNSLVLVYHYKSNCVQTKDRFIESEIIQLRHYNMDPVTPC